MEQAAASTLDSEAEALAAEAAAASLAPAPSCSAGGVVSELSTASATESTLDSAAGGCCGGDEVGGRRGVCEGRGGRGGVPTEAEAEAAAALLSPAPSCSAAVVASG